MPLLPKLSHAREYLERTTFPSLQVPTTARRTVRRTIAENRGMQFRVGLQSHLASQTFLCWPVGCHTRGAVFASYARRSPNIQRLSVAREAVVNSLKWSGTIA